MLKKLVSNIRASWPNPNMHEIKKDVLTSQPPRPQDIPAMAYFVRKWGGLPSGMLISELSELANVFIDPRRVVSGYFFQTLFDLAFLPTEMQGDFSISIVFWKSLYISSSNITLFICSTLGSFVWWFAILCKLLWYLTIIPNTNILQTNIPLKHNILLLFHRFRRSTF